MVVGVDDDLAVMKMVGPGKDGDEEGEEFPEGDVE